MIMSFLPSGALLWIGSMVLRLVGNLYGMESAAEVVKKGGEMESQAKSFWYSLSQRMDNSFLGKLAKKFDPYDIKATANLAPADPVARRQHVAAPCRGKAPPRPPR
jgi:hypothetical protein